MTQKKKKKVDRPMQMTLAPDICPKCNSNLEWTPNGFLAFYAGVPQICPKCGARIVFKS